MHTSLTWPSESKDPPVAGSNGYTSPPGFSLGSSDHQGETRAHHEPPDMTSEKDITLYSQDSG